MALIAGAQEEQGEKDFFSPLSGWRHGWERESVCVCRLCLGWGNEKWVGVFIYMRQVARGDCGTGRKKDLQGCGRRPANRLIRDERNRLT